MTREALRKMSTDLFNSYTHTKQCKLYHCSADIREFNDVVILRSYATVVAIYTKDYNTLYILGNYSSTTWQHVYKFIKWLDTPIAHIMYLCDRCDRLNEISYNEYIYIDRDIVKKLHECDYSVMINRHIFDHEKYFRK